MPRLTRRPAGWLVLRDVAIVAVSVAAATLVVAVLENWAGMPDASAVYLVAVVIVAMLVGSTAGVGTAVAAVLTYDLAFTEPRLTLEMTDSGEWLSLLLLSFVGITVGQLVALQRRRTDEAERREREAHDLYVVSRALATRASTEDALGGIASILADRAGLERVWFGLGTSPGQERVVADTVSGPIVASATISQLRRTPAGDPREWVILHARGPQRGSGMKGKLRHRVAIEADGMPIGSIWGERDRSAPPIDASASRLLATAADQIGQAVRQDRLARQAAEAKIAQASDSLKSALVENVSHDLRIPLASIRAAAGPLIEGSVQLGPDGVREAASAIDLEATRLDRLVANLLDLGRIQGGMLQPHLEAVELREVVTRATSGLLERAPDRDSHGAPEVRLAETWVDADPLLLEQVVSNVLENAAQHTPPGTPVLVTATHEEATSSVCLTIEDGGPGVAPEVMPRLFERFFRDRTPRPSRRPGSGIGLAVARGFVEAMGGRIAARRSDLGGLAIDVRLPATVMPVDLTSGG